MDLMELFNLAVLMAFIFFSAWAFYLKFKANRVTTTRDLLHAFITGGILAVTTMVFGVSNEIINASSDIKQDTASIRSTLEGGGPTTTPPNEQLGELLRINQQQALDLGKALRAMADLQRNSEQTNRLIRLVLENSGSQQELPTRLSGSQLFIPLNLFCTIPEDDKSSNCVVVPNER